MRSSLLAAVAVLALAGCSARDGSPSAESPEPAPVVTAAPASPSATPVRKSPRSAGETSSSESPSATPSPSAGATPPAWLGTRPLPRRSDGYGVRQATPPELDPRAFTLPDTVAELPGTAFAARVRSPAPAAVIARSTWAPGCPVAAEDLAYLRLTFWGFDDQRHTGELLVNASAARDLVAVFRTLYRAHFPIEQMVITTKAELHAAPTGDGNDTEAFVCRPSTGSTTTYSQHAYGLAIDVDPFQNPYVKGDLVLPELAATYLDRDDVRPGMATPDGVVVRAFAAVGWGWGGSWSSLKDFQHFSANGR